QYRIAQPACYTPAAPTLLRAAGAACMPRLDAVVDDVARGVHCWARWRDSSPPHPPMTLDALLPSDHVLPLLLLLLSLLLLVLLVWRCCGRGYDGALLSELRMPPSRSVPGPQAECLLRPLDC